MRGKTITSKYARFEETEAENIGGEKYAQWREDNQNLTWDASLTHLFLNRVLLSFSAGFTNETREDPFDPHREDSRRYYAWRDTIRRFYG